LTALGASEIRAVRDALKGPRYPPNDRALTPPPQFIDPPPRSYWRSGCPWATWRAIFAFQA